jgi:hypothetical protein
MGLIIPVLFHLYSTTPTDLLCQLLHFIYVTLTWGF